MCYWPSAGSWPGYGTGISPPWPRPTQPSAELVAWVNDRPFKKLAGSRRSRVRSLDRPALRPLPPTRYEFATWRKAKVGLDYHVEIRADRHYYSVPYHLVGQSSRSAVAIHGGGLLQVTAGWPLMCAPIGPAIAPTLLTCPIPTVATPRGRPLASVSLGGQSRAGHGQLAEAVLASKPHPEQGFRTCLGIVRLGEHYGTERLEAACSRALAMRGYSYRSVESMLRNGLDKQPAAITTFPNPPGHDNVRGPGYYN